MFSGRFILLIVLVGWLCPLRAGAQPTLAPVVNGEVLILPGDGEILEPDRTSCRVKSLPAATRAGDTREAWDTRVFPVWAQEYAHRWAVFTSVRDPRTHAISEVLLGRDCSHYGRFVDMGGSVLDGYTWRDNKNGTFTWTERSVRFSPMDMYLMGLYAPYEVPGFYFIDAIPGFSHGRCGADYANLAFPRDMTITGERVGLGVEDVIWASGHRVGPEGNAADSAREAIVVLTSIGERADSARATAMAARLNMARPWWDEWLRKNTDRRLLNCTTISAPCPDPRADLLRVAVRPNLAPNGVRSLGVDLEVENDGTAPTTTAMIEVQALVGDRVVGTGRREVGTLLHGQRRELGVEVRLGAVACGDEVLVRAKVRNETHLSHGEERVVWGTRVAWLDGFEQEGGGWTVNPDGDDVLPAGAWERARPTRAALRTRFVQPQGAREGEFAFVTGVATSSNGDSAAYVSRGRTTLQSPPIPLAGTREPRLRYALSFAGGRLGSSAIRFEPRPETHLTVWGRVMSGEGTARGGWVALDKVADTVTNGWTSRVIPLPADLAQAERIQVRFVAADDLPADGAVEVALDAVELLSLESACGEGRDAGADGVADEGPAAAQDGAAGCTCSTGRRGAPAATAMMMMVALLGVALVARRRRVLSGSPRTPGGRLRRGWSRVGRWG